MRSRSGWLAVAELYAPSGGELADRSGGVVDACDAVAAEVSAAQNISHARAVGQVQFACTLGIGCRRWPRCFCAGAIDFRMVSMIISRTENVDDALDGELG